MTMPDEIETTAKPNPFRNKEKPLEDLQMQAYNAATLLEHMGALDIDSQASIIRMSSIICTIGPSTREPDILIKLMQAGMNIARLNFNHGSIDYHAGSIANIRKASQTYSEQLGWYYPIGIAIDLKGPEIRTGLLENGANAEIELIKGAIVRLTTDKGFAEKGSTTTLYIDYDNMVKVVNTGSKVYIDDALISLIVLNVTSNSLICTVETGGILGSRKIVNLPGSNVDLPVLSEKDREDIDFGIENGVDMIFASFIREAAGIKEIREIIDRKRDTMKNGSGKTLVLAKIENQQGITNIDDIIDAADGVIVSRGNLGNEIPIAKVFIAQKSIIAKANKAGKPVICFNQMLESMVKYPRPTRAEASDVGNAILDGVDCLMLSGETAKGDYPLESVVTMSNICKEAEATIWQKQLFSDLCYDMTTAVDAANSSAIAAVEASNKCNAAAIIVITTSGRSAQLVAKYRPKCPILAVTKYPQTARQVHLWRGVLPLVYNEIANSEWLKDVDARVQFAVNFGMNYKFITAGDPIVVVTGWKQGTGFTNTIRIVHITPEGIAPELHK